jgi:hypothetical protein
MQVEETADPNRPLKASTKGEVKKGKGRRKENVHDRRAGYR